MIINDFSAYRIINNGTIQQVIDLAKTHGLIHIPNNKLQNDIVDKLIERLTKEGIDLNTL